MEDVVLYREESFQIVAAAIKVWKTLGYGFLEKVYENALVIELRERGIDVEQQKPLTIQYHGCTVGDYVADLVIDDKIILELKCARSIDPVYVAQTLNYLKATGLRLGLILNFGPKELEFKRVIL